MNLLPENAVYSTDILNGPCVAQHLSDTISLPKLETVHLAKIDVSFFNAPISRIPETRTEGRAGTVGLKTLVLQPPIVRQRSDPYVS